jgi:glycosyltransferase involved in cell wall biosynthesis
VTRRVSEEKTAAVTAGAVEERAGLRWLEEFAAAHGRPLRVLHLGNIANNGYVNAKIQRSRGIDADASANDYFHVMGSPEWEDADFEGDVVDDGFPDWWNVDMHGFRRPDWFAQGSCGTCQRYLLARRANPRLAPLWRRVLTVERWLWCRSTLPARALGYRHGAVRALTRASGFARGVVRLGARLVAAPVRIVRGESVAAVLTSVPPRSLVARVLATGDVDATAAGAAFERHFPDRPPLRANDLDGYRASARGWDTVFDHYDVVQGYSLDAVTPFICGKEARSAYEHGTLRAIPFENSARGRICALAFAEARAILVTNSDVLPSVERLGLDPRRVVFLPHAVDSDRLLRFADEHAARLAPARGAEVVFYSPSRQDWRLADPSLSKGNDRLLLAAAELRDRYAFRLVLTEWGRDVQASRDLVVELGLTERVEWTPLLRKSDLWRRYLASHAVVDQFVLPAIGGIAFEAMALGRRVVTALDQEVTERFFGAAPPVMAAAEVDQIAAALEAVLTDPDDAAGRGEAAREWFARFHSADRIVDLQARAYRRMLEETSALQRRPRAA